jgi:hypothetical protein
MSLRGGWCALQGCGYRVAVYQVRVLQQVPSRTDNYPSYLVCLVEDNADGINAVVDGHNLHAAPQNVVAQ